MQSVATCTRHHGIPAQLQPSRAEHAVVSYCQDAGLGYVSGTVHLCICASVRVSVPPVEVSQVVVVAHTSCREHALQRQARHNVYRQPGPATVTHTTVNVACHTHLSERCAPQAHAEARVTVACALCRCDH